LGPEHVAELAGSLRASDSPGRFQKKVLGRLLEILPASTVAWFPRPAREAPVLAGEVAALGAERCRAWLASGRSGDSIRFDEWPVDDFPAAMRPLLAVAHDATAGWLVVAGRCGDGPWPVADARQLQAVAALIAAQRTNARGHADLKELLFGIVRVLTSAIDAKDPCTAGHSLRVARIAARLGEALGLSSSERGDLYLMGLLHDVGNLGIEDRILKKPGRLTPNEVQVVQSHVRIGVNLLSTLRKLHHLLPGLAHHHESVDGSGYPSGIAGQAIPLSARILAVADAFDAMLSDRPHRPAMPLAQAEAELRRGAGNRWDRQVVDALFTCRSDIDAIRRAPTSDASELSSD
jgi:hypothetical protein